MAPITPDVDVSMYLPPFLAESGEHLAELNVAAVRIEPDPSPTDTPLPAVRPYMALAALGEHGDLPTATPSEDELEGFTAPVVEAWLRTDQPLDVLAGAVKAVPEVEEATLFELGAGGAAPRP